MEEEYQHVNFQWNSNVVVWTAFGARSSGFGCIGSPKRIMSGRRTTLPLYLYQCDIVRIELQSTKFAFNFFENLGQRFTIEYTMAERIPSEQIVIRQHEGGTLKITPRSPIPELKPYQILVRTHAVGLNPCDFKMPARFPTPGLWSGCDFAGTVVKLGDEVALQSPPLFEIGDAVFGAVHGSNKAEPQSGAYCEYLVAEAAYTFKTPAGMSHKKAVAMYGTGIATIAMALYSLKLPGSFAEPALGKESQFVLVFGGSSTVGMMAIQLLKL